MPVKVLYCSFYKHRIFTLFDAMLANVFENVVFSPWKTIQGIFEGTYMFIYVFCMVTLR
jgi:hypothetical protein